jgi:hypothetical protein
MRAVRAMLERLAAPARVTSRRGSDAADPADAPGSAQAPIRDRAPPAGSD